ncbi:MAG: hypothetical protein HY878_01560 [Deltaproteobacteria bacterium]|nr:hypothetical protein [Deltaproteobacteria bacterium]
MILSLKHAGKRVQECDEFEFMKQEATRYGKATERSHGIRMELKALKECSRERLPVYVELYTNGIKVLSRPYRPGGWEKDGPSFVYEKVRLKAGEYKALIRMRDSGIVEGFDYTFEKEIEFKSRQVVGIDFDEIRKGFYVR